MPKKVNNCDICSKNCSSKFTKQCLKCSKDGLVFVCDQCSVHHDHFKESAELPGSSKKDDKKALDAPIHNHDDLLLSFSTALNLASKQAKELSMANQIKRVEKDSKDGKVIVEYFTNSLVSEFANIENIWSLSSSKVQGKKLEKSNMNTSNTMLLWNGILYQNLLSLLTSGFRIPDQHDRVNKKPKFLYFHDRIIKDAVVKAGSDHGVLLLSEVCLGRINITSGNQYIYGNPDANLYDSVKLLGKNWPDESEVKFIGKVKVPVGQTVFKRSSLEITNDFNDYIVFDIERINIKYIVHFKKSSS